MSDRCTQCGNLRRFCPCPYSDERLRHGNPRRDEITIEGDVATVTRNAFDRLGSYDTSLPTGSFIGKRWKKRHWESVETEEGPRRRWLDEWSMGEFTTHPEPGTVGIVWRDLVIADGPLVGLDA